METTNKKLADRITKGEVTISGNGLHVPNGNCVALTYTNREANAELIKEAWDVTQETGLSPRELKEQRDEAVKWIEQITNTQGWLKGYKGGRLDTDVTYFLNKVKQLA